MSATLPSADELTSEFAAVCEIFESGEASATDRASLRALWGKIVQKMSQFEKDVRNFESAHRAKSCALSFEDSDGKVIMARKFDHDVDALLEKDNPGCVKLYELAKGYARTFARYIDFIEFLLKDTAAPNQQIVTMDPTALMAAMNAQPHLQRMEAKVSEEEKPKKAPKKEKTVTPQPEPSPPADPSTEEEQKATPSDPSPESDADEFLNESGRKSTFQKLRDGDLAKK